MRISIIMPLYNAEKYLAESLESVLNQTFRDFELLCIDDCSTDGTGTILHDFKQKDSRIRIINNSARQGAALSRNTGIKAAKGDYLIFLDGDDIFDEELLLTTFNTAEATKADIVMFDYMHVNTNEIYIKRNVKHGETYIAKYCSDVFSVKKQKPYEFVGWHSAACNKLYRKTFIEENHLEFQDLESSNDVYFSYMSLLLSEKTIVLQDDRVMVYARDHNELSRISHYRNPMCAYRALEHILSRLIKRGKLEEVVNHYFYQAYFSLKAVLYNNRFTKEEEHFYSFLQSEGVRNLWQIAGDNYNKADNFIKERMKWFVEEPYQSRWFERDNLLDIYLKENTSNVKGILENYKRNNKKIGVWGAGRNGESLINFCKEQGIEIDIVVDADVKKAGKTLGNYVIYSPEAITNEIDIIIVSGVRILESVEKFIHHMQLSIKLEDINMIVGIY